MNTDFVSILKRGGIGVLPTDTIYGLVGSALIPKTVERIYKVRQRDPKKPFLILIASLADLKKFEADIPVRQNLAVIKKFWPGKVTIILPLAKSGISKFKYLHRGTNALAFRLPKSQRLIKILKKTGPLVAPSANISGFSPATNLAEARKYFGENADFYISGKAGLKPSKIISLKNGKLVEIRK